MKVSADDRLETNELVEVHLSQLQINLNKTKLLYFFKGDNFVNESFVQPPSTDCRRFVFYWNTFDPRCKILRYCTILSFHHILAK